MEINQEQAPPPYGGGPGPSMFGAVDPGVGPYQKDNHQPSSQPAWGYQQPPPQPYQQYPPAGQPMMMYPPPPPPQQQQQQQQQQVVVIGGPGGQQMPIQRVDSYVGAIALSCFVFWCCNCLFGLIAFILAMVASSSAVSDPVAARQMGRASTGVSVAGIIVTVVIIVIVVGVAVGSGRNAYHAVAFSSSSSSSSTTCNYYYLSTCYTYKSYTTYSFCNSQLGTYNSLTGYCYLN